LKRRLERAAGFAYIEVMVAVLLLALCALPAANAIKTGLTAADAVPSKAAARRCMRDKMEAVLAEPYANLLAARNGKLPTTYSEGAANGCVARSVYIDVYPPNGSIDAAGWTALLRVDVVSPDTNYSFTTLVAP